MVAIEKDNSKGYRFLLKSEGGQTLLRSIPFSTETEVNKTLKKLKQVKGVPIGFERKTDHQGRFMFNLKDSKGNLIAESEGYTSEAGMENGIKNLREQINRLSNKGLL